MAPVRVALVGCGVVSGILVEQAYPALAGLATVVATVDARRERAAAAAAALGARPFATLGEALAAVDVDAVDIRLPHHLHAAAALEAVAAGRHVLVEKPLATTLEDGARVVAAARAAGVVLCVAENYRFLAAVHAARGLLDDGAIGTVLMLRTQRICTIEGIWDRDGWRTDGARPRGGVILDQGCHQADLLRCLAGEVTHVHAVATDLRPGWRGEDSAALTCRLAGGRIAQTTLCWGTPTPEQGAEACAYGTEGSLELRMSYAAQGGGVVVFRSDLPGGHRWAHEGAVYGLTFEPTLQDWLRACAGEGNPRMPGIEGLRDLAVVDAAYRSLDSGREEAVTDAEAAVETVRVPAAGGAR